MNKLTKCSLMAGLSLLCVAQAANAALLTGDFRTESDLPGYGTGSPLIYQSLGQAMGQGFELDSGDFLENPDSWSGGVVFMDYDPSTNILTLDSQDSSDFQTFDAWIANITFDSADEYISGISLVSNALTTPSVVPSLSFTNNSLHVSYDFTPDYFLFTGGIATFQIETQATSVPEPGSTGLFLSGLIGLIALRRRSTSSNITA